MWRFLKIAGPVSAIAALVVYWLMWGSLSVERDDRPSFQLDPNQPFIIALGRGSGIHGLDTINITQDGRSAMSRIKSEYDEQHKTSTVVRQTASFQLRADELEKLLGAVETYRLTCLHRAYHDTNVNDGTQWVLWIKQGEHEKSVYFNNYFPRPVKRFAKLINELIMQHWHELEWQPFEGNRHPHERELWDSIER